MFLLLESQSDLTLWNDLAGQYSTKTIKLHSQLRADRYSVSHSGSYRAEFSLRGMARGECSLIWAI